MQADIELFNAMQFIQTEPQARRVFETMLESGGTASGWSLAKSLGDPDMLTGVLQKLTSLRIVDANGSGLEGYYYLAPLGFRLRSVFVGSR